jgi:hypothetical protein
MSVNATVLFGGATIPNVTLKVRHAYIEQNADEETPRLVYHCTIIMPNLSELNEGLGWTNVPGAVDLTGSVSPLVQAEIAMVARLTAEGATDIVPL